MFRVQLGKRLRYCRCRERVYLLGQCGRNAPVDPAFHTPMFTSLGVNIAFLGVIGLAVGWFWDTRAAAAMAVISGVAMLALISADAVGTLKRAGPETGM